MNSIKVLCIACTNKKTPNNVICSVCKLLNKNNLYQYLSSISYFQIFNITEKYQIDKEKLSVEFKNIQKNIHPDILKKQESPLCSSLVNIAYKTLMDDYSRAQYLLKLNKYEESNKITLDSNSLMKFYEIQEKIEVEKNEDKLKEIKMNTLREIENNKKNIGSFFESKQYQNVQEMLNDIKYKNSIINSIDKKLNLI